MKKILALLLVLSLCPSGQAAPRSIKRVPARSGPVDINRTVRAQQFALDAAGNIYYAEILWGQPWTVGILRVPSAQRNRTPDCAPYEGDTLKIHYCGHPTGMAVENAADGPRIWISNFASRKKNGQYWDSKTVCRVPYEGGKEWLPEDPQLEHFWFPHEGHMNVALDEERDQIAFSFYPPASEAGNVPKGRSRRVRVYRLSEVLSAPLRSLALGAWRRGGPGEPIHAYDTVLVRRPVRDLSGLKPVAEIGTHIYRVEPNPMKINSTAWQGFDLHDGVVWFSEGSSRSGTFLTGYGLDGSIVFPRTAVAVSFNGPAWSRFGLGSVDRPALENEGVRVWDGTLCLSFFGRHPKNGLQTSVFRFALPRILKR